MMTTLVKDARLGSDTGFGGGSGDGRERGSRRSRVNVGEKERNVSMAAGAIVAVQGLSRGTLSGLLSAAVGGYLIYRGATGHCPLYRGLDLDTYHADGEPPGD